MESTEKIRQHVQNGKIIVGLDRVVKALQQGGLTHVIVAQNFPAEKVEQLKRYAALAEVSLEVISQSNEELGVLCRKNFLVSVVGLQA